MPSRVLEPHHDHGLASAECDPHQWSLPSECEPPARCGPLQPSGRATQQDVSSPYQSVSPQQSVKPPAECELPSSVIPPAGCDFPWQSVIPQQSVSPLLIEAWVSPPGVPHLLAFTSRWKEHWGRGGALPGEERHRHVDMCSSAQGGGRFPGWSQGLRVYYVRLAVPFCANFCGPVSVGAQSVVVVEEGGDWLIRGGYSGC